LVVLETSAGLASIDRRERHHQQVVEILPAERVILASVAILAEITFMIERRLGRGRVAGFLASLANREVSLYWDAGDLERILALEARYRDLPIGLPMPQ
jgi:hypothetical protein